MKILFGSTEVTDTKILKTHGLNPHLFPLFIQNHAKLNMMKKIPYATECARKESFLCTRFMYKINACFRFRTNHLKVLSKMVRQVSGMKCCAPNKDEDVKCTEYKLVNQVETNKSATHKQREVYFLCT